jgi:hypothetical protein
MEWKDMQWIYLAQDKNQLSCEQDNEPSGFIKFWDVLEWLSHCLLLEKDSAP